MAKKINKQKTTSVMEQVQDGQTFAQAANQQFVVMTPDKPIDKPTAQKGKKAVPYFCQKELLSILGTAESLPAAPYENQDFEIWAVAVCTTYPTCKRADLLFEMHGDGYWKDKNVLARLKKETVPIYMHEKYKVVPNSMRYPIEEIVENHGRYFTNSIAYMLALALHSFLVTGNPKHVAMFGVHMAAEEEYTDQRPCCEYWIGVMRGAGMSVDPSPGGAILSSKGLYGYENYHPVCYEFRKRIQGLQAGLKQSQFERDRWVYQMGKQEGGITENQIWLRRFQTGDIPENKK